MKARDNRCNQSILFCVCKTEKKATQLLMAYYEELAEH